MMSFCLRRDAIVRRWGSVSCVVIHSKAHFEVLGSVMEGVYEERLLGEEIAGGKKAGLWKLWRGVDVCLSFEVSNNV